MLFFGLVLNLLCKRNNSILMNLLAGINTILNLLNECLFLQFIKFEQIVIFFFSSFFLKKNYYIGFNENFFLSNDVVNFAEFMRGTMFFFPFDIKNFFMLTLWLPLFISTTMFILWTWYFFKLRFFGKSTFDATTKFATWLNLPFEKRNFLKSKNNFYPSPLKIGIVDFFALPSFNALTGGLQYFYMEYFFVWRWVLLFIVVLPLTSNELIFFQLVILYIFIFGFGITSIFPKVKLKLWVDFSLWGFGTYFHRNSASIKNLIEDTFYWNRFYSVTLLVTFITFLLTSCLVLICYILVFFQPFFLWNGYFIDTILIFNTHYTLLGEDPYYVNYTRLVGLFWLDYFLGLDSLNVWLVWLTSLLTFLCVYFLWDNETKPIFFTQIGWIFFLEFSSFQFFCVCDYLWMYIFFELSLLPIFILMINGGSTWRRVHAAYQMVFFTFVGSMFLLTGILMLFLKLKTFNYFDVIFLLRNFSDISFYSTFEKKLIWLFIFLGFAVKTPLYPFHIWLPEAHSEAPTVGSVLLAGVLLKMGTYGLIWFLLPLFPEIIFFFWTIVFSMCLGGIILSSLAALAQIDIKKIIAYSSIGHMGLVTLGLLSNNLNGLLGGCFMMISHGLIASALFFSIGILYWIYGTWSLIHYSCLSHLMPRFSIFFFFFCLSNMGFPGTAGFPAELLIFSSLVGQNLFFTVLVSLGSVITGIYMIWLLTWLLYGQISNKIIIYRDLKPSEWWIFFILLFFILLFGLIPFCLIDFFKPFVSFFLN